MHLPNWNELQKRQFIWVIFSLQDYNTDLSPLIRVYLCSEQGKELRCRIMVLPSGDCRMLIVHAQKRCCSMGTWVTLYLFILTVVSIYWGFPTGFLAISFWWKTMFSPQNSSTSECYWIWKYAAFAVINLYLKLNQVQWGALIHQISDSENSFSSS